MDGIRMSTDSLFMRADIHLFNLRISLLACFGQGVF